MVGLSVVLETKSTSSKLTQVINKATNISFMSNKNPPTPPPLPLTSPRRSHQIHVPAFLDQCFLCGQKLLPGTDTYMYKGDRGFCSEECRYKQIFMDEDDLKKSNNNCSLMASSRASSSSSSGASRHNNKKGASRNRVGGFAY